MRLFVIFPILAYSTAYTLAQPTRDQGLFIPYQNTFYNEINKGIKDFTEKDTLPVTAFKMDLTGKSIPKNKEEFTTLWCNSPISQGRTGTCWSFATSSFYETEIFRQTKQKIKLSEMFTAYWEYIEKAREFTRTRGESFFGEGSETNAVARMMKKYGAVPESEYTGMKEGQVFHDHIAMYNEMRQYLETVKRDNSWNETTVTETIRTILNHYIDEPPASFIYKGKKTTPLQFLKDVTKLNPDDYVNFMSLMEAPYYHKAEYRVPDNWWKSNDYNNVPLDDFMDIIKNALKNGFTLSIGGDVSESGNNPLYDVAMIPTYDIPSEYIDENARQLRFSNGSTTDDHAIHLIGYKEAPGGYWFLVKDSGSSARNGKNKGYYFYHEDYVKLKVMSFTVHKDAVSDILKKIQ